MELKAIVMELTEISILFKAAIMGLEDVAMVFKEIKT